MMEQSLALFQKRDDLDELEGFQQQELAKVKHMVRTCGVIWLDLLKDSEAVCHLLFVILRFN